MLYLSNATLICSNNKQTKQKTLFCGPPVGRKYFYLYLLLWRLKLANNFRNLVLQIIWFIFETILYWVWLILHDFSNIKYIFPPKMQHLSCSGPQDKFFFPLSLHSCYQACTSYFFDHSNPLMKVWCKLLKFSFGFRYPRSINYIH